MDDTRLLSIINAHREDAYGAEDSELTNERAKSLDHYYGRPYGDEEEGQSQVVSRTLREVVEWVKPALIKIFTQSGNLVEFKPVGPDDEEAAQQESDVVNHVIMDMNNGVMLLLALFHDGLLLKNSYCKHYIEESEKITERTFSGLSDDELLYTMQELQEDKEAEITEQEFVEGEGYSIRVKLTETVKKVIVEAAPTEEIRVSRKCKGSLQTSLFTEHVTTKIRTELIEMGMDAEFVNNLPAYNDDDENEEQAHARDTVEDEYTGSSSYDISTDEIEYCEAFIQVDYDDDKKAELRRVVTVANKIPPGKEWNQVVDSVAITGLTPKPVPHRHIGESMDDDLDDLQQILTVLKRQLLNNTYRINSTEKVINKRVNVGDAMRHIAGNIVRVDDDEPVQGSVMYQKPESIIGDLLPAIELIKSDVEERSGVNEISTNLDPNVLKEVNNTAYLEGVSRASQKVELMARMFAEGIKEIAYQVHGLLREHQDKPMTLQLRGEYVSVNPTDWQERTDVRPRVGLGTGSEEEKRLKLSAVSVEQEKAASAGLVGPQQVYNLFEDMAESLGVGMPSRYVMQPDSEEHQQFMAQQAQQQESNPLAEAEMVKGQANQQIEQIRQQSKQQIEAFKNNSNQQMEAFKEQSKQEIELYKAQVEAVNKEADRRSNEAIAIMTQEVKAMIEGMKVDMGQPGIGGEFDA
jgi:hypothetical protein